MRLIPLAMLGFGNVGQAFARLLIAKQGEIEQRYGAALRVVGIGSANHGTALDQAGLDLQRCLQTIAQDGDLSALSAGRAPADSLELLQRSAAEAVLESTPVNYESGQPAIEYLEAGLKLGMHAISANKGPVVHAYRRLTELAERSRRRYFFESAVMDGAPIFALWRETLPAARLHSFRGILNSTTNFILTRMEAGEDFESAVGRAQQIGIAETDPTGDIQGWDAAVKVAALVNVLMDHPLTIGQVERQGIESITFDSVRQAQAEGRRWKLICSAERQGADITARVAPQRLGPQDPLYSVMGTSSAVTLVSDVLGDLTVIENDPGPQTTAYGMLADLLSACKVP